MSQKNIKPGVEGKILTAAELIELLKLVPPNARVTSEGCSVMCGGQVDKVYYDDEDNFIILGWLD